jgi:hypothetical protein
MEYRQYKHHDGVIFNQPFQPGSTGDALGESNSFLCDGIHKSDAVIPKSHFLAVLPGDAQARKKRMPDI